MGSVEEKSKYKETLLPWTIGVLLIGFSVSTLPSLIYDAVSNESGLEVKTSQMQVSLNKSNVTLNIGENEEEELQVTVKTKDGTNETVTWTSSNTQVATVDSNGKITAKSVGTTIITATAGEVETTCKVTVTSSKTTNITISKTSLTLEPPETRTYQLQATVTPATSTQPISWSSSNNNVATVQNGKVKATGAGTAVITVKSGDKSASCTVQVNSSRVYAIQYYNPSTNKISSTRTSNSDLAFVLYIPDVSQVVDLDKLPLIIYLHGGQKAYLNDMKRNNPLGLQSKDYPAICIFPECPYDPDKAGWYHASNELTGKLKKLIDHLIEDYHVDENKISLTGFSNGGSGTWHLALKYPKLFSCLVIVSGYSRKEASVYPDCPVWLICSTGDASYGYATKVEEILKNKGQQVKLDNRGNIAHADMQPKAYTREVILWMAERSRATNSKYQF